MTSDDAAERRPRDDPGDGSADETVWSPDDVDLDTPFETDGATGGAAEAATEGEPLSDDYWFDGERAVESTAGEPFLWAMSGAALYAASFVFAALGVHLVAPSQTAVYLNFVSDVAYFLPLPIVGYVAGGLALEVLRSERGSELPETTLPIALILPVFVHLAMFYVEGLLTGFSQVTIVELLVENPGLSQLVLWPPVIMGAIFVVIAYQTTTAGVGDDRKSERLFEFRSS